MSRDWNDYSSQEDELFYSRYFNMEEEVQKADAEKASKTAAKKAPSSDEMTGLQKTNEALQTQMRFNAALPNQFQQEEKGSQAAASQAREETLHKEMEYKKTQKEQFDNFANSEYSLRNDLLNESEQREKILLEEIARLKEEVATEANLRQEADDERGVTLVNLKLEMFFQAAAAKTREEALQKQFDDLKTLREAERDNFTKSQERFEEERKSKEEEMCRLKEEVANEAKLRQRAEDERGMTLVDLKLELASQASVAKAREDALLKEMEDLKSCEEFQLKSHNTQLNQLLQEHGTVKSGLQGEIATLKQVHANEIDQQSRKMKVLQGEMEETKEALINSEKEKASFTKETIELKKQIMHKVAEIKALKNEVSQRTDSLEKVTVAARQKSQESDMEKQTLLKETEWLRNKLQKNEEECKLEKQALLKQMDELKSTLQKNEADNQALSEKSTKLEVELAKVRNKTTVLGCHLKKEAEQKAQMVEQIQLLKKQIKDTKEEAVQASTNWEVEKTFLMKNLVSKIREKESEKQTLMKKIKQVEHEAVQQKASHKQAMSELQEEKACMLKETQDLKTELKRNGEETKLLHEMVSALYQELEKKRRRWFKRLFDH